MDNNYTQKPSVDTDIEPSVQNSNNPNPPTQQLPVQPPAPKPKRTWLWVTLAVLAVLALVAGAYYLGLSNDKDDSTTTTPAIVATETEEDTEEPKEAETPELANETDQITAGWKTYTSDYYGAEIKHPDTINPNDLTSSEGRFVGMLSLDHESNSTSFHSPGFTIFREARFGMCGVGPHSTEPGKPDLDINIGGHDTVAKAMCGGQGAYLIELIDGNGQKANILLGFIDSPSNHNFNYRHVLANMTGFKPAQ